MGRPADGAAVATVRGTSVTVTRRIVSVSTRPLGVVHVRAPHRRSVPRESDEELVEDAIECDTCEGSGSIDGEACVRCDSTGELCRHCRETVSACVCFTQG
jgi:hypothetical protein